MTLKNAFLIYFAAEARNHIISVFFEAVGSNLRHLNTDCRFESHFCLWCLSVLYFSITYYSFITSLLDGSEWLTSRPGQFTSSPSGKDPRHPFQQEAGWAPKSVWTIWRRETFLVAVGIWIPDSSFLYCQIATCFWRKLLYVTSYKNVHSSHVLRSMS
jgi:hypothetical protein